MTVAIINRKILVVINNEWKVIINKQVKVVIKQMTQVVATPLWQVQFTKLAAVEQWQLICILPKSYVCSIPPPSSFSAPVSPVLCLISPWPSPSLHRPTVTRLFCGLNTSNYLANIIMKGTSPPRVVVREFLIGNLQDVFAVM